MILGRSLRMSLLHWNYQLLIGRRATADNQSTALPVSRNPYRSRLTSSPMFAADGYRSGLPVFSTADSGYHVLTCAHIASFRWVNSCTAATLFMKMTLLSTTAWFSRVIGGCPYFKLRSDIENVLRRINLMRTGPQEMRLLRGATAVPIEQVAHCCGTLDGLNQHACTTHLCWRRIRALPVNLDTPW